MTVKTTAENIKSRFEALTEVIGVDPETEEEITKAIFDMVVIGNFETDQLPPGRVISIRSVMEENTLDFAGPNPPSSPFTVPWHITLYVSGPITDATLEVYRLVPIIKASIESDMAFSGSCREGFWDDPSVVYDETMTTRTKMISGARIRFKTNY